MANVDSTYISKTLTLSGGHTTTNWTTSQLLTQPTILDAAGGGRVIRVAGPVPIEIASLTLQHGRFAGNGGGVSNDGALTLTNVAC